MIENQSQTLSPKDALCLARDTFLRYAILHASKGTEEGNRKSLENFAIALIMKNTINSMIQEDSRSTRCGDDRQDHPKELEDEE